VKIYSITVQTVAQALALVGFVQVVSAQMAPVQALPDTIPAKPGLSQQQPPPANGAPAAPGGVALPADYVIGPEDVLAVLFWRDKEMSGDYVVRPDGQITLPLLNDVQAAGLTPEQLRDALTTAASKLIEDPSVTVGVKAINSRKVFITGMVGKGGAYPLTSPTTVVQLISVAGGLHEFADEKNILIVRAENGRQVAYKFNYRDFSKGKNLKQNILLKPGDQVIVP
jgi:polysaccharide export outer membrane protein